MISILNIFAVLIKNRKLFRQKNSTASADNENDFDIESISASQEDASSNTESDINLSENESSASSWKSSIKTAASKPLRILKQKAIAIKTLANSIKERQEAARKSKKADYYLCKIAKASKNSYQVCDPDAIACAIARHKKLMAKAAPLMERRAAEARARMADYALQKAAEASMNGYQRYVKLSN